MDLQVNGMNQAFESPYTSVFVLSEILVAQLLQLSLFFLFPLSDWPNECSSRSNSKEANICFRMFIIYL